MHLKYIIRDLRVKPLRLSKMTELAYFMSLEEEDADDRSKGTYSVNLIDKLVPTKESFDQHISWLETTIKDEPHSRILKTTLGYHCYMAELSSEALLKVRQRSDVYSVESYKMFLLLDQIISPRRARFYKMKESDVYLVESFKTTLLLDRIIMSRHAARSFRRNYVRTFILFCADLVVVILVGLVLFWLLSI